MRKNTFSKAFGVDTVTVIKQLEDKMNYLNVFKRNFNVRTTKSNQENLEF